MDGYPDRIVCVGSVKSNIGKTTLSRLILQHLHGWSAIKLTTCSHKEDGVRCPRSRPCGVCTSLKGDYEIITRAAILLQPGKGTRLLSEGGAREVRWVKSRKSCIAVALQETLKTMSECEGIVIEGNSSMSHVEGSINLMVCPPEVHDIKTTALEALPLVNAFIVNVRECDDRESGEETRENRTAAKIRERDVTGDSKSTTVFGPVETILPDSSVVFRLNPTTPTSPPARAFLCWLEDMLES
jgi:hypothetical protein